MGSDDTSPVKPIEIPPPRPKKKPLHPYPRKMVASSRTLVEEHSRRSASPISSASEQDNQSPTSVFSALGSEMFDTTDTNTNESNENPSPVSSPNGVNTSCLSISEPNSSPMESESALLDQLTDSSHPDEQVPLVIMLSAFCR